MRGTSGQPSFLNHLEVRMMVNEHEKSIIIALQNSFWSRMKDLAVQKVLDNWSQD